MKKATFIKNAFILTATSLLLRTIGIFFRIYMSNKVGAEGMGLYQLIFSIYVLGSTFATSGISTAVTRLVADELVCGTPKSVRHILHRAIALSLLIGAASTALIFFGADIISAYWIKDMRAVPALKILPARLFHRPPQGGQPLPGADPGAGRPHRGGHASHRPVCLHGDRLRLHGRHDRGHGCGIRILRPHGPRLFPGPEAAEKGKLSQPVPQARLSGCPAAAVHRRPYHRRPVSQFHPAYH